MTVKAHKMWRRGLAQVTIFGLIFQAAVSAFMLPMPVMQAAVAAASHGQEMVICTSLGFERVSITATGETGKGGQPSGSEGCPVCVALAPAAAADLPVIAAVPQLDVQPAPAIRPAADRLPERLAILTQRNRGPPQA